MGISGAVSSIMLLISLSLHGTFFVSSAPSVPEANRDSEESATPRTPKQEQEPVPEVHCSRERSRAAWKIIEDYLVHFMEQEHYQLPNKCRLHPGNDLFRDQEQHKIHLDMNEWQCGYCKKSFRAEKFLDQHFDSRHYSLLNVDQSKCLADLCGTLHCDYVINSKYRKTKCNPAATIRNRHLCESVADNCFPVSLGSSASRLHELFLRQFCDAHTCSEKRKPFPRGGKKEMNLFYLAICVLTLMMLPLFYVAAYLYHGENQKGSQELRRISQLGRKTKPI